MIDAEELPEAWKLHRLADICLTKTGGTTSRKNPDYFTGATPWVKSGELEDGIIATTEESITEQAVAESNAKVFPKGTLLMAMYGATVGKLGRLAMDAATNQAVCAFFPKPELNSEFLWHYLRGIRAELLHNSFGAAQPNISQTLIKALEIPVPPLAEQRRLVARIEALTSSLAQARQARQAALAEAETLLPSQLGTLLGGVADESWERCPLGKHVRIGGRFAFKSATYRHEGIPIVRISNLDNERVDVTDSPRVSEAIAKEAEAYRLKPGEVLIALSGATTGKLGVVPPPSAIAGCSISASADFSRATRNEFTRDSCSGPRSACKNSFSNPPTAERNRTSARRTSRRWNSRSLHSMSNAKSPRAWTR